MSAETLHRAASLMRERAEAASSGPWACYDAKDWYGGGPAWEVTYVPSEGLSAGEEVQVSGGSDEADAGHIASWHPAVALAVAKAMDDVAHAWEIADESADGWVYDGDDNYYPFEETVDGGWLTVARAYLGESA